MIKAVFFDIDGTLVSFKTHVVPKSTLHAIELLKKKGIKVFIATGRHRRSINNLGDLPGSSNPSDRGYLWKDGLPVDRLFYGRAGETYYEGLVAL